MIIYPLFTHVNIQGKSIMFMRFTRVAPWVYVHHRDLYLLKQRWFLFVFNSLNNTNINYTYNETFCFVLNIIISIIRIATIYILGSSGIFMLHIFHLDFLFNFRADICWGKKRRCIIPPVYYDSHCWWCCIWRKRNNKEEG